MRIKDKHRLNLYIDPEIVENAKEYASTEGYSLSTLVAKALKTYIETGSTLRKIMGSPDGPDKLLQMGESWTMLYESTEESPYDPYKVQALQDSLRELSAKNLKKIKNG